MSAEKEKEHPAMKEPDAPSEATIIRETVTYGIDGRCSITFAPYPKPLIGKTTVVDFTNPQKFPRWKLNRRRSAGFIDRDMLWNLALFIVAMLWIFAS
jgi:hypothetical protein